jgi:hypothetical protein
MYQMPPSQHNNDPKTRLIAVAMLVGGIIGFGYLGYLWLFGGSAYDIVFFIPPFLFCYGLLGIISPDHLKNVESGGRKWTIIVSIVSVGISIAIQHFLFKDWKTK